MPSFHHVPIGNNDQGFLIVSQEETVYHDGNSLDDVRFEDCLPFEELSKLVKHCTYKCLPVIAQSFYKESIDLPKCEIGSDHDCMFKAIWNVSTYLIKYIQWN